LSAIFGSSFTHYTRIKDCTKTFRPKWSFIKSTPGLEPARQALLEAAPLAAAPALGVDPAVLGGARELLVDVVLHGAPEEGLAAVASLSKERNDNHGHILEDILIMGDRGFGLFISVLDPWRLMRILGFRFELPNSMFSKHQIDKN
jgi:hypothetical protein